MAATGAPAAAWVPPSTPGPILFSKLPRVQGAPQQNDRSKQECYCPVCPPPPAEGSHTAQRRNLKTHLANKHPAYTFVDDALAASLHSRPLNGFFQPVPPGAFKNSFFMHY